MSSAVDYLIVGGGLTGRLLQLELMKRSLNAVVYDTIDENHSTQVAAGLVNPIVGKYFTVGWRAQDYFPPLAGFYQNLEKQLDATFFSPQLMKRIIASAGEQNLWLSKAHLEKYSPFCTFHQEEIQGIQTSYGVLHVHHAGVLDTREFLRACTAKLTTINERFEYDQLDVAQRKYKDVSFQKIVFCEGYKSVHNPFFQKLDIIVPTKGEMLEINAEGIPDECTYLGPVFIQPIGPNTWRVGATYEQNQTTLEPTLQMHEHLIDRFKKIATVPFDIKRQYCGIRPASKDRKPILGRHPSIDAIYFMNGMGSKAISMVPLLASEMADFMEHNLPLPPEVDLRRFC